MQKNIFCKGRPWGAGIRPIPRKRSAEKGGGKGGKEGWGSGEGEEEEEP